MGWLPNDDTLLQRGEGGEGQESGKKWLHNERMLLTM